MAEQNKADTESATAQAAAKAATQADATQQFKIQRVYLKDVSYESPKSPSVFLGKANWQPNLSLQLNTESFKYPDDIFEVVLTVSATVKLEEEIAYLVEIKQAGLFLVKGLEPGRLGQMLGSFCPNLLFPFAREEIATLVQKGGFPQLLLDPVNFDALYAQHVEAAKQNAPAPETPQ
ncbi:MAG: protein-export chaperone SecB [Granulosicoccus sp.]|nr:protein-export chaperone SecB [Granulosicoccus sp.]